ncbi:hypothetical protein KIW84_036108 [Lathyrus oleraceus]|uniref:Uncharacterized protein n=1 Tax=Pisum sativum TaxID=3888 RepID=A0A9D4Y4N0_PEA|nr:hypothetical protein KIW84_036108 [Pisum sativum]
MGEDGEPLEEDLVHEDDDLTWAQVTEANGNEPVIYTRRSNMVDFGDLSWHLGGCPWLVSKVINGGEHAIL